MEDGSEDTGFRRLFGLSGVRRSFFCTTLRVAGLLAIGFRIGLISGWGFLGGRLIGVQLGLFWVWHISRWCNMLVIVMNRERGVVLVGGRRSRLPGLS